MGDNCEHGNDVRYGCKHCDDAGTEPPLAGGRMTDLPDAVVNAAVEAFARKRNPKHNTLDHSETLAIRAALAAASGPWAEHLREIGVEQIRGTVDDMTALTAKSMAKLTDDLTKRLVLPLIAERDAALARNAELEAEVDEWKSEADDQRGAFVWANGVCQDQATQKWAAIAERDTARAELDNLRDRVTALADEIDVFYPKKFKQTPSENYVLGWRDLQRKIRAAIVRGSDDEAGEPCDVCGLTGHTCGGQRA